MGRKKKNTTAVEQQPKVLPAENLSYTGTVKVSIQRGNKTILSTIHHNKGCVNLFKFICNALAGNFAANLRPCKIALFGKAAIGTDTPSQPVINDTTIITPYLLNDTTAIVKQDTANNYATTTYHFRIPYAYLQGKTIYKAALYSLSPGDADADKCAYYLFQKSDGTDWDPLPINTSGNLSLIIEWTLTLKNSGGQ